jgi:DNA-directed RNA polymerase specialized sigma24 family protein
LLDTIPATDDTETSVALRTDLRRFISEQDDLDQEIILWKMNGQTEREIGAIVGMSGVAVHQRLVKIQTALRAII